MSRPSVHTTRFTCPHPDSFEKYIRERFLRPHAKTEAAREVTALARDTSLSNAVSLAIESLPTAESATLRRLVDAYESWCQKTLVDTIMKNARPFVRSFKGETLDVMNPYSGKQRVRVEKVDLERPVVARHDDVLHLHVHGRYLHEPFDLNDPTTTEFSFDILVNPDLTVKLHNDYGHIDYAPAEMLRGLRKALER